MTGYELLHALEQIQKEAPERLALPVWVYGVEGETAEAYEIDVCAKYGIPGKHYYRPDRIVISP